MFVTTFLYKILQKSLPMIHKKRLNVLLDATATLFSDAQLTLTDIGRHIKGLSKIGGYYHY